MAIPRIKLLKLEHDRLISHMFELKSMIRSLETEAEGLEAMADAYTDKEYRAKREEFLFGIGVCRDDLICAKKRLDEIDEMIRAESGGSSAAV